MAADPSNTQFDPNDKSLRAFLLQKCSLGPQYSILRDNLHGEYEFWSGLNFTAREFGKLLNQQDIPVMFRDSVGYFSISNYFYCVGACMKGKEDICKTPDKFKDYGTILTRWEKFKL